MNPYEAEQYEYAAPGAALETLEPEQAAWEIGAPGTYEHEAPPTPPAPAGLSPAELVRAVNANRLWARRIGWGCIAGGQVRPIPELLTFLHLPAGATEQDVARAVAQWQQANMHQRGEGHLNATVWGQMLRATSPVITLPRFKRMAWEVTYGGHKLGVLEKVAPYQFFTGGGSGGAFLQLGFRITDMDAVRRAGFVYATGDPHFNWIQRIITNRQLTGTGIIRRHGRYIDPQDPTIRDNHPYYWNIPGEGNAGFRVGCFSNRPPTRPPTDASCGTTAQRAAVTRADALPLCYDLIFQDYPSRPLSEADPGRRVYWNTELALVGILPPKSGVTRNVVLNTVLWGFDLVVTSGVTGVRLNALRAGPFGGSTEFRQVLSDAIKAGNFAGHCFDGGGYSRQAHCA